MDKETLYIGSHVSMNAPEFYLGSVKEAVSYGSTTFMFYTGAPQNSYRKPLNELKIEEARKLIKEAGINEDKLIVHAPYIINPANFSKPDLYQLSIDLIANEVKRTAGFHAKTLVLHPGASVGQDREQAMLAVCKVLDTVFEACPNEVKIALETMSGKGTEVGITFEEIAFMIEHTNHKDRLGVCLDTCHISDGGYSIKDFENILERFDKIIGLNRLLVIHLNDSKNPEGSHKDRHENIGYGFIGFDTLNHIVHHPKLVDIPKILETPYVNDVPPYKFEIVMLKTGKYIENWREDNF